MILNIYIESIYLHFEIFCIYWNVEIVSSSGNTAN